MHLHHVRHADEAGDRIDVAQEYEIELLVERRIDRVGGVYQEQRVPVGCRLDDGFRREIVPRARAILDDELLAEPLAQPVAEKPRQDVGRPARRIANDNVGRPDRIVDGGGT